MKTDFIIWLALMLVVIVPCVVHCMQELHGKKSLYDWDEINKQLPWAKWATTDYCGCISFWDNKPFPSDIFKFWHGGRHAYITGMSIEGPVKNWKQTKERNPRKMK